MSQTNIYEMLKGGGCDASTWAYWDHLCICVFIYLRISVFVYIWFVKMDAVMLSHGHWDHAGGLTRALDLIVNAKGFHENNDGLHARYHHHHHDKTKFYFLNWWNQYWKYLYKNTGESGIPCYLHPGMFRCIPIISSIFHVYWSVLEKRQFLGRVIG